MAPILFIDLGPRILRAMLRGKRKVTPNPAKREKVKAARKQRNKQKQRGK